MQPGDAADNPFQIINSGSAYGIDAQQDFNVYVPSAFYGLSALSAALQPGGIGRLHAGRRHARIC